MPPEKITAAEVRRQLAEILSSREFPASERLQRFLSFIVEESLQGRGDRLKAYSIAVEVFKLGKDFDPTLNPLIRVEAGRLRSKLDHYYLACPTAPVRISIPKGNYAAHFSRPAAHPGYTKNDISPFGGLQARGAQASDKPTILVLPFTTVNKTEEVERFVAGLVNEITIDLTKFTQLAVAGYNQNMCSLQDKDVLFRPEARFILGGSVEIENNALKIWVCLTDAAAGVNVWAEKFCGAFENGNFFALQDSIAECVSSRIADDFGLINRALLRESSDGGLCGISAREAALRYYQWTAVLTLDSFKVALLGIERALDRDPGNVPIRAMLSDLYGSDYCWSYGQVENALERSFVLAIQAVNLEPGCQGAHVAAALNYYLRQDKDMFIVSAEKAISLNPSNISAVSAIGTWYGLCGEWERSFELINKALAQTQIAPAWCHANLSLYYYLHGDYEAAFAEANKITMPGTLLGSLYRLIAGGKLGREKEAQISKAELLKIYPDFETQGHAIISRHICNEDYADLVCQGLTAGGIIFSEPARGARSSLGSPAGA